MADDEVMTARRAGDGDGLKQARLNRAQEYLDQVATAQTKSKARNADNRSFITHKDLLDMQDKIHERSNTKRDKSMPQDAWKTSEGNLLAGHQSFAQLTKDNLRRLEDESSIHEQS